MAEHARMDDAELHSPHGNKLPGPGSSSRHHGWKKTGHDTDHKDVKDGQGHYTVGRTKAPYAAKTEVIRTKMNPKALYQCELSPTNETALRVLRAGVA